MNTYTLLTVKTEKGLKNEAKKVAEDLGVPLSTVINSFLKQFVREKEITLSANTYTPTPALARVIRQAQLEYEQGDFVGPMNKEEFLDHLRSL
jgi:addiction module RelB/DinJ family antitoxin